ncbi:secretin N-terminal domain-containing protein [Oxalobacteraceae bacterium R-40]|uniref:Secretin N-terminal domain-containing protein n=1 Tax=Keguizhuia sedimenti TaxID=3064264 RepID=A0ABU1BMJ9_9BURK|nr:secretin N-terminal domain-containing protein [Oxalobacteraceae bacterium R-40]
MRKTLLIISAISVAACTSPPPKRETYDLIGSEMAKAAEPQVRPAAPDAVAASLLPPLKIEMPEQRQPLEQRFNLAFNNLPAQQFFMTLVSGTRYSMLVPPEVTGTISANLKDVTIFEALDAIREMYGYDYKVEGTRIYIKPLTLQTRVFQVNYLTGSRTGTSDIRVTSGSVGDVVSNNPSGTNVPVTNTPGANGVRAGNSSNITTRSTSDFWGELRSSLEAIIGSGKDGRSVVISPQSGVVVVRGMWNELRDVASYLKATQLSVDRQVILEAKIIEVQLNDSFQSGINWAAFSRGGNSRYSIGQVAPGTVLQRNGALATGANIDSGARTFSDAALDAIPGLELVSNASNLGGLFGLAFQTSNFAALLSFLETQGTVHVLSSPRIATLNNQKAVLKVGTDEFFVTNVSTTTTTGTATTTNPTVTLQPFFSGVALDVTPQVDDAGNVILHIHPSVSNVTTVDKNINLGSGGSLTLPLAASSISETDSIVRGKDGQIVAIGGLMRQASASDRSQLPGADNVPVLGALLSNRNEATQKRELVILLKPIVVQGESTWTNNILETQQRIQALDPKNRFNATR